MCEGSEASLPARAAGAGAAGWMGLSTEQPQWLLSYFSFGYIVKNSFSIFSSFSWEGILSPSSMQRTKFFSLMPLVFVKHVSFLKCLHFPVWVASKSIRFSIRHVLIGILFLFSCCTCLSSIVGYLVGSARVGYSVLSVQRQHGPDTALPPLATESYGNSPNESSFPVLLSGIFDCKRDLLPNLPKERILKTLKCCIHKSAAFSKQLTKRLTGMVK